MNELHELHELIVKTMNEMEENDSISEEYKNGSYNTMYMVEEFIKQKLEEYIERSVNRYEDSKTKAKP